VQQSGPCCIRPLSVSRQFRIPIRGGGLPAKEKAVMGVLRDYGAKPDLRRGVDSVQRIQRPLYPVAWEYYHQGDRENFAGASSVHAAMHFRTCAAAGQFLFQNHHGKRDCRVPASGAHAVCGTPTLIYAGRVCCSMIRCIAAT